MFSLVLGFAGVWHITWLAAVALVAIIATVIGRSFGDNDGYMIPAAKVREIEGKRGAAIEPKRENVLAAAEVN